MITYSKHQFKGYDIIKTKSSIYYSIKNVVNRKSIFFSLIYNKNKEMIHKNNIVFIPYDNENILELAKFISVIYTRNRFICKIDMNDAVNNYVGGDIEMVKKSMYKINKSKHKVIIYICVDRSGENGLSVDTINTHYLKIKNKKVLVLASSNSMILKRNREKAIDLTIKNIPLLINDEVFNYSLIKHLTINDYLYWKNVENHINKNIKGFKIRKNMYGMSNTLIDFKNTLLLSRYNIDFDDRNKGVLNCGVEGSGKSYLGEKLSKISGVVTIREFDPLIIKTIIKYNTLWSFEETSLYLIYMDECDRIFFNPTLTSIFKEVTGSNDFPGNIFIYATSNHSIDQFDKSLYRTGRLQYQYWGYLREYDIKDNDEKWIDIVKSGVNIRYVDYMIRRDDFLNHVLYETESVYKKGSQIKKFDENETRNRTHITDYTVLKKYNLSRITMRDLEYLIIRYKIKNDSDHDLGWYIKRDELDESINPYKLDFYIFVL